MIDPIAGDSRIYQSAPARVPSASKKNNGRASAGRDFEIESVDMVAIDRLETDRQCDVAETEVGDFGDERRRDLGRFPEIEDGTIALLDQPFQTVAGGGAAAGQLEVDGDEPSDPGPDAGRR